MLRQESSKNRKLTNPIEVAAVLRYKCCKALCAARLDTETVRSCRKNWQLKSEADRSTWLVSFFSHSKQAHSQRIHYHVNGTTVCKRAFAKCYGITQYKLTNAMNIYHGFQVVPLHGNNGLTHKSEGVELVEVSTLLCELINLDLVTTIY
jgi:hypothetical protein